MADVGKPEKEIVVVPLSEPVPANVPEGPVRKEPVPDVPVKTPEKVPA